MADQASIDDAAEERIRAKGPPPQALILFGATGDLSQRMLWPSLYHLFSEGRLPDDMALVGCARGEMDDATFRTLVADAVRRAVNITHFDADTAAAFVQRLFYHPIDAEDPTAFKALAKRIKLESDRGVVNYLATAPSLYGKIVKGLASAGLAGPNSRVVLEKPIGKDLESSRVVNTEVGAIFGETQIFRIDHYLGKETVQNLLVLRFGNALFEPLWNAQGIAQVQITVSETVGLEGRAAYYDGVGALRDMVQNHLLQLLALVAMEPPARYESSSVRNEKIKVLRSLKPITPQMIETHTVAGQYGAGAIQGEPVKGYAEELGKLSSTETFVAVRAEIENWRWAGVPFYLRTGKRLPTRYSEIAIQFRPVPHSIFAEQGAVLSPNKLLIRLQPEETVRLTVMAKEPSLGSEDVRLREVPLDLSLTHAFAGRRRRIAYERLILDAIEGDPTLFVRRDEVEAAWTWIDGILEGWRRTGMTPRAYAAGTWGPSAAIALPERFGHSWHE